MADLNILKPKKEVMKLDNTDLNILGLLRANGRFTIKEIARKLKVPREIVQYRLKNYVAKGLIQKWDIVIDHSLLKQCTYEIQLNMNTGYPESIMEKLKEIKNMENITTSNFDSWVILVFTVKDTEELKKIIHRIKKICNTYIKNSSISIITKDFSCAGHVFSNIIIEKNYSKASFQKYFIEQKKMFSFEELKPVHHKLINLFNQNSREPIISLAEKANISVNTAIKKIKELISWGIIFSWTFVPDYSVIGIKQGLIKIKTKSCSLEDENDLDNYFKNSKRVYWCLKYIGSFDYSLDVLYKDYETVLEFIKELKSLFGSKIETLDFVPIDKIHIFREYNPE